MKHHTQSHGSPSETAERIIKRLEAKVDVMRLEFKATGNHRKHDMDEMLSLLDVLKACIAKDGGGNAR